MLFSSLLFLFAFLPIVLLINIILPSQFRNKFLLLSSLIFFAWGGVSNTLIFIISIILNFISGIIIDNSKDKIKLKRIIFIIVIIINISILCIFKYLNFFIENINVLFQQFDISELKRSRILLPIGISFYTFHGLSYIIDVYRGTTKAQRKFSDLGLYISFFPQLIAGPIIRYKDIEGQLHERKYDQHVSLMYLR